MFMRMKKDFFNYPIMPNYHFNERYVMENNIVKEYEADKRKFKYCRIREAVKKKYSFNICGSCLYYGTKHCPKIEQKKGEI